MYTYIYIYIYTVDIVVYRFYTTDIPKWEELLQYDF